MCCDFDVLFVYLWDPSFCSGFYCRSSGHSYMPRPKQLPIFKILKVVTNSKVRRNDELLGPSRPFSEV